MPKGGTEIIVNEVVPLSREQAAALDQLIGRIRQATGFTPSRATLLRGLASCFPLLQVQAQRVRDEKSLCRALIAALDDLDTAEIEAQPE